MDKGSKEKESKTKKNRSWNYLIYLTLIALFGWTMASFDFNLFTLTLPLTEKDLHFTLAEAGLISGIIYLAMFIVNLIYGPLIDRLGRKLMFQISLLISAIFTGLTYFVTNFLQFIGVRFVSDGSAFAELPTGLTLVTEESPPKYRGILYGFVQGGWPLGVFVASAIYLALIDKIGWRGLYLVGVLPLVVVIIGRLFIKESPRFKDLKEALSGKKSTTEYKADLQKARQITYLQLFDKEQGIRKQLFAVVSAWMLYTFSFVTTNVVISGIFTKYYSLSAAQAASILLISSAIGYFAYPLAGWYGSIIGRRNAWAISSVVMPITALIFLILAKPGNYYSILYTYIPLYFFSNGTFASVGFMYASESYPTRIRGTAIAFLMFMISAAYSIGGFLFYAILTLTNNIIYTWIILAIILPLFIQQCDKHDKIF